MSRRAGRPNSQRHLDAVPALNVATPYTSRLSARSALYTEFHALLDAAGDHDLGPAGYRALVIDQNCLARSSSAQRAKLWKELRCRYRLDTADHVFSAFLMEWRRAESEAERALTAYVLLALGDRLVLDLGCDVLYARLREAPSELRVDDVLAFFAGATAQHPEISNWSETTRLAVAQKYTTSIRDFGLACGTIRKTTRRPALYGSPVRLLVRALRMAGVGPLQAVQAHVFRLLALHESEVIPALGELNRSEALHFRMQGDVVELDLGSAG
jgi:hypothetical protein